MKKSLTIVDKLRGASKKKIAVAILIFVFGGVQVYNFYKYLQEQWNSNREVMICLALLLFYLYPIFLTLVEQTRKTDEKFKEIMKKEDEEVIKQDLLLLDYYTIPNFLSDMFKQFSTMWLFIFVQIVLLVQSPDTVEINALITTQTYLKFIQISMLLCFCAVVLRKIMSKTFIITGFIKKHYVNFWVEQWKKTQDRKTKYNEESNEKVKNDSEGDYMRENVVLEYKNRRMIGWNLVIPIILLLVGVLLDIIGNTRGGFTIIVTEAYMEGIYAAVVSISVLCFSFIALISGFLDRCYYGYKLKEILQFKESPVNFKRYVCGSLTAVIIATFLFAIDFEISCANSMTSLLLMIIFLEGKIAFDIYRLMTNEAWCYDIVISHFKNECKNTEKGYEIFRADVDRCISALEFCVKQKDFVGKEIPCDMLSELSRVICSREGSEDYYDFYNYFYKSIKEHISEFANVFGYSETVKAIIKIYKNLGGFDYGRIDLFLVPLKNMRFKNDQQLFEKDYFSQINEMDYWNEYTTGDLTDREVEMILYHYFDNIMKNKVCSSSIKKQIIEEYIARMAKFQWSTKDGGIQADGILLLDILKYYVLQNENIEERNHIFLVLIRQIFYNNNLSTKDECFDFLALLFQAFYSYIFREKETLNEKYRNGLKDTFMQEFSTATIVKMNASWLLKVNIVEVLKAIGRRIINNIENGKQFEYFPGFTMVKSIVWTPDFDIDFLFMLYLIYNDEVGLYSIYRDFIDWKNTGEELKLVILKRMTSQFDFSSQLLKAEFAECYMAFAELLKHTYTISEASQKKLFKYLMKELEELTQEKVKNLEITNTKMEHREITEKIDTLMKKENVFGWSPDFISDCCIEFFIPDYISRREYRTEQSTARTLQQAILSAFEKYIQGHANKLTLSFDFDGVKKLLSFLKETTYDARNYTFTEDWALAKYSQETDFINLVEEQKKVERISTPGIQEHMFFTKNNFMFNAKILKMEFVELTEKECVEFLDNSKCYNGLYNIDGALMSKEKATKCVQKIYVKEKYAFQLMVSFERDEVTCIHFKY